MPREPRRFIGRSVAACTTLSCCSWTVAPTCTPFWELHAASAEGSGPIFSRSICHLGRPAPGDPRIVRLLLERGATCDLAVAAALGDADQVRQILDVEPERIRETRPSGRRPLSAAFESGHDDIAGLLLERGADPNWPEPTAPKGRSLPVAASAGNLALVKLLLAHGADPDSGVASSGTAVSAGATPEIRALLEAHGGTNDPYDTTVSPLPRCPDEPSGRRTLGHTPLQWAERRQHQEIAAILRRHGAER